MYASTSTMRPTRRRTRSAASAGSDRTSRQPRIVSAISSVDLAKSARAGSAFVRLSLRPAPGSAPRDVERLQVARDQEPEHGDEPRDHARPEEIGCRRAIDQVEQVANPAELGVAGGPRREAEVRIEDDDHAQNEEERLDDAE